MGNNPIHFSMTNICFYVKCVWLLDGNLVSLRLCSSLPLPSSCSSLHFVLCYPVTLHTEQNACLIMLSPSLGAFLFFCSFISVSKLTSGYVGWELPFFEEGTGAFVIIGHLSIGATAVLFDPNCFDLDEIRADVLICICHAPNVVSWTPETSVLCCHFSPSQKILTLFCVAWCSGWLFDRFKWPFFHCLWWFIGISYVTGTLIHLKISQVVL